MNKRLIALLLVTQLGLVSCRTAGEGDRPHSREPAIASGETPSAPELAPRRPDKPKDRQTEAIRKKLRSTQVSLQLIWQAPSFREQIQLLRELTNVNFVITPEAVVQGDKPTGNVHPSSARMSAEKALTVTLEVRGLKYRILHGGVYIEKK